MNSLENKDILKRLEDILDSFLQPNYTVKHNIYFEKLIKHFSQQNGQEYLQAPFFIKWIEKCTAMLMTDYNSVNPQVTAFCYHMSSLILANEWLLVGLKRNFALDKLIDVIKQNKQHFNPSVKLGAIRFIKIANKYSLGCATITNNGLWRYVLCFLFEEPTVYIAREAREFLFDFLYNSLLKSKDEKTVEAIFNEITKPIFENFIEPGIETLLVTVDDDEKWKSVESSVDLMCYILEKSIENPQKLEFLKYCDKGDTKFKTALWKLTDYTMKTKNIQRIFKCVIARNFAHLLETEWNGNDQMLPAQFSKFGVNFYNIVRLSIGISSDLFLHCMQYNFILWHKLGNRTPSEIIIEDELVCFPQMILIFHVVPILHQTFSQKRLNEVEDDPYSQQFLFKLFKLQTEHAVRLIYAVRDSIDPNSVCTAVVAIKSMFSIQQLMHREQAILVFQTLMQVLRGISESLSEENENCNSSEKENLYFTILVGIESLIQRFQITWRESMESICLANIVVLLLDKNLSTRMCVQALKVMQLSIGFFMAPNMALLIDDLNGSSLSFLGPLIVRRLHDSSWEVRDSALELVHAITQISRIKFQAFQKFLIEYNLFELVFNMSKHDTEAYVRASAFKSLAAMVAVDKIWENMTKSNELFEHLFDVMYNENEAIVRMQAVVTMAKIYEKRKIPDEFEDKLYSIFTYLAISDLHWEVNISALYFWKLEILRRCTDQGMIDGTFPTVTFSKEHKKIVQLTPKEINLRITKIINELTAKGCLAVLYKCLTEEYDLIVARKAGMIIKSFQERIHKYDFEPTFEFKSHSIEDVKMEPTSKKVLETEDFEKKNADEIIKNILDDRDIDCLVSACDQFLQLKCESPTKNILDSQYYKKYANMHTLDFLNLLKSNNLHGIIENREKWVEYNETFESLVEDMWYAFNPNTDCNIADCY